MHRLDQLLMRAAARAPAAIAITCGAQRLTYAELGYRARGVAGALYRRGVGRGERVALFAGNALDTAVAFWGILHLGAIAVPINPLTRTDKLAWLLAHCRAVALVSEARLATVAHAAASRVAHVRTVLVDNDIDSNTDIDVAIDASRDSADALAAILYTSGSTGRPKGVMLSHRNMLSASASICAYLALGEDDVVHGTLPLAFDYGLYQMIMAVRQGARLVLAEPFLLPAQILKQAAAERVTFFPGVPTMFAMLGELRELDAWDLSSVRAVTNTAAALTERHLATIARVFPRARVFSMYGITECKRCTYLPPADLARKPGSVGIAIPDTELWLVDALDRRLGPNEVGQVVIRGPHVMQGYWEDPQATARALRPFSDGERVLYTGDLGRLDADGYLYFVGRMDDIIKSRGEKVAPKEVEAVLSAVPGVLEAAVIGVPDDLLGQAIVAFVVPATGAALVEADLRRACREQLESYMVPRTIAIVPSLPKSGNGKIDKRALQEAS